MEAEDPYAQFIRGRGGLCVAKEVGMHVHASSSATVFDKHMQHMQAGASLLATVMVLPTVCSCAAL